MLGARQRKIFAFEKKSAQCRAPTYGIIDFLDSVNFLLVLSAPQVYFLGV